MQETPRPEANKRPNMTPPPQPPPFSRRAALTALLLCAALASCVKPSPPAQPLAGRWQGVMASGNASVPSEWDLRGGGTFSLTLTLPQGAMTALGTWSAQGGVLTQRTTARAVVLGTKQKSTPLANSLETTFAYQLQGGTLTLTRPGTREQIVLTREENTKER